MLTTPTSDVDVAIEDVASKADAWAALAVGERVAYLNRLVPSITNLAEEWVTAAVEGKQIRKGSALEGEEWSSGPSAVLSWLHAAAQTLEAIDSGKDPLAGLKVRKTSTGRTSARVYPANVTEAVLLSGYSIEVWMQDGVTPDNVGETIAAAYRLPRGTGAVALVLGAGNIASIAPLDLLYKLFVDLEVVIVKLNPINDYLGPVLEKAFAPLVRDGYLRFVYGAADVGEYLTQHPGIDSIHITGSARTHDAIVFGSGDEGRERKARNDPRISIPITSELGGVSPTIIVPGPWTDADIAFQAEHVATQKLHNSGYNCIASQVLVMPEGWDKADAFLAKVTEVIDSVEDRAAYYPGTADRQAAATDSHPEWKPLGVHGRRTMIAGVDPDSDADCFTDEFFAPILATTALASPSAAEFLAAAVEFSNRRLYGTLGANILIHPETAKELGTDLERAVENLNYGNVGVNAWTGVAYLVQRAAWGAAPGHTLDDVQSGIGVVHNALMFDQPQKSVVWAPFRPFPRSARHGDLHMSPKPFWFVTHKTADIAARRFTYYTADGKMSRLPGIFAAALRG